jgi:hypothetical protein
MDLSRVRGLRAPQRRNYFEIRVFRGVHGMNANASGLILAGTIAAILAGCGGGGAGSTSSTMPPQPSSNMAVLVSDASTEDWAMVGVKIMSIALVPQGGGANVTVYNAPNPVPVTNLVDLDNLSQVLGSTELVTDAPLTFTGAIVTLSANPGDVSLTAAADPQSGFQAAPGTVIPATSIQIQHAQGSVPNLTVAVPINFTAPLTVTPGKVSQLNVEFDLGHPAFIMAHTPPALQGATIWAVNFSGPMRRNPLHDITRLVLRHAYGEVVSVSADNTSLTISQEFPTEPPASPETPVLTGQSLQVLADTTSGTLLYDLDAHTRTTIMSFANLATTPVGAQVRIAARYQADGTLVATRIWISNATNAFNSVWASPEGHVLHVDSTNNVVTVENELGQGIPLTVNANTQFFFRTPQSAQADSTPIATGTELLSSENFVRGFKVHATVVDPLASPQVADSIDIETAKYDGSISAPSTTGSTLTHNFQTASDDYSYTIDYISPTTANGIDPLSGNPISGFKWWYFAFPTALDLSVTDWVTVTNDAINLGGPVGAVAAHGVSFSVWNDPANANAWSTNASIVTPSALPIGAVATGLTSGNTFTLNVPGGTMPATVDVSTAPGAATLVYQVDRTNGIVTVSQVDITTAAGLMTLTNALANVGTPVKVYGVPLLDTSLKAYVLTYFSGTTMPAM